MIRFTCYVVVNSASGYVAEVFDSMAAARRCVYEMGAGWHVIERALRCSVPAGYTRRHVAA